MSIQVIVWVAGPTIGFTAADIIVRSLRSRGAMAILLAKVGPDTIRIMGEWWSDTILRYLHNS